MFIIMLSYVFVMMIGLVIGQIPMGDKKIVNVTDSEKDYRVEGSSDLVYSKDHNHTYYQLITPKIKGATSKDFKVEVKQKYMKVTLNVNINNHNK